MLRSSTDKKQSSGVELHTDSAYPSAAIYAMEPKPVKVRQRRLHEQDITSKPGWSASNREPARRLSMTLLFCSTTASIIASITYLLYRLKLTVQEQHVSFTMWTVLAVELLTAGR